jgi:hypothetical protein
MQVPPIPFMAPMQVAPAWQMAPAQHGDPAAQLSQVRAMPPPGFAQARPPLQLLAGLAQHCMPLAPQAVHIAAPPPMPAVQRAPGAVQVPMPPIPPPPQHAWPTAPQGAPASPTQEPFMHMPAVPAQFAPLARHVAPEQQPPLLQELPAQQAWPVPPQFAAAPPAPPAPAPPVLPAAPVVPPPPRPAAPVVPAAPVEPAAPVDPPAPVITGVPPEPAPPSFLAGVLLLPQATSVNAIRTPAKGRSCVPTRSQLPRNAARGLVIGAISLWV